MTPSAPAVPPQTMPRSLYRALLLGLGLCLAQPASAQPAEPAVTQARPSFDVPAGPLGDALALFAAQAGIPFSFDVSLTQGRTSAGLQGARSVEEGFAELLSGTGLQAVPEGEGRYRLRQLPPSAGGPVSLPPVAVKAASIDPSITENTNSYTTKAVSVGGKTARDPRQVQQSVSVITAQRIRDQNLTNAEEMLGQATGVTLVQSGGYASNASFNARGFSMGLQMDGGAPGLNYFWYHTGLPDAAILDHIEVLRGSDGLFGGAGNPGGTVNLVRKRALDQPQVVFDALVGTWDRARTQIDATGPLGWDGRLRGRVVVAEERRKFFYDDADSEKTVLYGVVEADLMPGTLLSAGISYEQQDRNGIYAGLPRYSDGTDLKLPRSTCLCTDWSDRHDDNRELFIKLDQSLGESWRFRVNVSRQWLDYDYQMGMNSGAIDPVTRAGAVLVPYRTDVANTVDLADLIVDGRFSLFGVQQELIAGFNWQDMFSDGTGVLLTSTFPGIDVFNFNPAGYPQPATPAGYVPRMPFGGQKQTGLYASLRSRWTDSLYSIVGLRNSSYEYLYSAGSVFFKESNVRTPYAGLNYDLTPQITVYGSYAQIFQSQAGEVDASLKPLKPVEGNTYEVGAKGSWYDGALTASLALYQIDRENERQQVSTSPQFPNCCYVAIGEIQSRGVEGEITGELTPGWQLTFGYAFNRSKYKSGYGADDGVAYAPETPKHQLKLWTMGQLRGSWSDVRVGGGVNWQSDNYIRGSAATFNPGSGQYDGPEIPYQYTQDAYAVVSLRGEYRLNPQWSVALNVNNALDETYYQTVSGSTGGNYYGEPRHWQLSVQGRW